MRRVNVGCFALCAWRRSAWLIITVASYGVGRTIFIQGRGADVGVANDDVENEKLMTSMGGKCVCGGRVFASSAD